MNDKEMDDEFAYRSAFNNVYFSEKCSQEVAE